MKAQNSLTAHKSQHWTAEDADSFAHKVAFDFIVQIEKALESENITRAEFAQRLGVTQSSVSQVLNNPQNLTLKTVAKYCQSMDLKAALLTYQFDDPTNQNGLINPEVFRTCWQRWGEPRDFWQLEACDHLRATTGWVFNIEIRCFYAYTAPTVTGNLNLGGWIFFNGNSTAVTYSTGDVPTSGPAFGGVHHESMKQEVIDHA